MAPESFEEHIDEPNVPMKPLEAIFTITVHQQGMDPGTDRIIMIRARDWIDALYQAYIQAEYSPPSDS
jgi:hypothetical protein